jgi:hypothetical protein
MQSFRTLFAGSLAAIALLSPTEPWAKGAAHKAKSPVIGVVTDGVAERLGGNGKASKKAKKKTSGDVGKTFSAICDGTLAHWKVSDLGDDGAWVGQFVGAVRPKHCMLVDAPGELAVSTKGRANATPAQVNAAKAAATIALTPKKGEAPKTVELTVFHDGEGFVAVAQATTPVTNPKSNCLDHTALVVMSEQDGGAWKTVFRPQGKGKDICGYSFFTRGDVDGDGRDEIALRIDRGEGYGYRVIKRKKGSYDLLGK